MLSIADYVEQCHYSAQGMYKAHGKLKRFAKKNHSLRRKVKKSSRSHSQTKHQNPTQSNSIVDRIKQGIVPYQDAANLDPKTLAAVTEQQSDGETSADDLYSSPDDGPPMSDNDS